VHRKVTHLLTKVHALKQKRDRSNLGKVVSFATQDIPNTEETTNPASDGEPQTQVEDEEITAINATEGKVQEGNRG
jgi:hypothetical protein